MGQIQAQTTKVIAYLKHLLNPRGDYSIEKHIFQIISIATIVMLCVFMLVDTIANIPIPPYLLEVVLVMQFVFLFLSLVRRIHSYIINLYIFLGIIAIMVNFVFNAGVNGPSFVLFFMPLTLALSISERKWYPVWLIIHLIMPICCLIFDSMYPEMIRGKYPGPREQYIDFGSTMIVAMLYVYFVTTRIRVYMAQQQAISANKSVQLAASELKLQAFFEGLSDQFYLLDDKMNIVHFNSKAAEQYQKQYGIEPKEGQSINPILLPSYRPNFLEDFKQSMAGVKISHEQKFNFGDWQQLTLEPARDKSGVIIGVTLILKDITEQKLNQQRLENKNALLEKIAFIQAHEFRGPLTSVQSLLPLIKEEYSEVDPIQMNMMEDALAKLDQKIIEIIELANEAIHLK
jgi:PAS domain S-box-containing protein